MTPLEHLIAIVNDIGAENDCGDNSCSFVEPSKKKGMRTNGGCRCDERRGGSPLLHSRLRSLFWTARKLRDALADAERLAKADAAREGEG